MDHPRVGGEKNLSLRYEDMQKGSPPRGRGKVVQQPVIVVLTGITPAWAGKSCAILGVQNDPWDHPRVGGEKPREALNIWRLRGSPPRGRGKAQLVAFPLFRSRITPAWAGKSARGPVMRITTGDHPRVGGEKSLSPISFLRLVGSPPRGRGKDRLRSANKAGRGITPAWAGKSLHFSHFLGGGKDHPRVGGEKHYI